MGCNLKDIGRLRSEENSELTITYTRNLTSFLHIWIHVVLLNLLKQKEKKMPFSVSIFAIHKYMVYGAQPYNMYLVTRTMNLNHALSHQANVDLNKKMYVPMV